MENMGNDRENLNTFLEEAELQQYSESFREVLKITKVSQLKYVVVNDLVQIGLSKPEQRRYRKIYSKYYPNSYIYKFKKLLTALKKDDDYTPTQAAAALELQPFQDNNLKAPTKHIISIEDISINKELGKGQFGVVQQGTWITGNQRVQVAIKCLGQERMTSNSAEFLKEAAVMHSIEHPNIVRLYGVVLHSDSLMLVTELAPLRSLLECLRELPVRTDLSVPTLCLFAEQICDGMSYLEKKRLIHRDLAARNILVFSRDRVKISDFGLSRALGVGKDYYQINYNVDLKLPVAWCAPECILFLRFTSASDVWAFGVCLWEMFSYGFQPWNGLSGQEILASIDHPTDQRLNRPLCCPQAYYSTMLECWSYDPNARPKFRDLASKLRSIRPDQILTSTGYQNNLASKQPSMMLEQILTTTSYQNTDEERRLKYLEYKAGEIITVLEKDPKTRLWFGAASGGACGIFDPNHTKPYVPPDKCLTSVSSLSPNSTRHSARSIRSTLLRCDVKRHTYTSKRTLQRSMISSPQGDVKHTGHVGLDGAYFGDISFLDPAGCPPRQVVSPYRPSDDLEQVPLINPNSPSHLSGASGTTPYPMLASARHEMVDNDDLPVERKHTRRHGHRSLSESTCTTGRGLLNKVKCATLGRHKNDTSEVPETEDIHEYHEISDETTDSTPSKSASQHDELDTAKNSAEFSLSLIAEMETLFLNFDAARRRDELNTSKLPDGSTTLKKAHASNKRRHSPTSTMKPMSAHDEKTLNTAVALANEITSKSMNDLGADRAKHPHSPSDRSKFHFKFPLSLHQHGHSHDTDKDKETSGKPERRNFSEETQSVPDIQSSLTEESKMAYISLIDEPTPAYRAQMANELANLSGTIPKPGGNLPNVQFLSLPKNTHRVNRTALNRRDAFEEYSDNPLPLPPRTNKPKLVDMPRHIRKHPLKIPPNYRPPAHEPVEPAEPVAPPPIIYQNTTNILSLPPKPARMSVDVVDGIAPQNVGTNPFTNPPRPALDPGDLVIPGPSGANPFAYKYDEDVEIDINIDVDVDSEDSDSDCAGARALVKDCKDHVSVEDLLEFADQKPCGRQRGVESDEVRIMRKVFSKEVSPEECLEALELSDWNVHNAIKLVRVSRAVGIDVTLEECSIELAKADGDITKAAVVLVMSKRKT